MELGKERFVTATISEQKQPEWNTQCIMKALLDRLVHATMIHVKCSCSETIVDHASVMCSPQNILVVLGNLHFSSEAGLDVCRVLNVSVWHKGGTFEKDRFLGRATLPLSQIGINDIPKLKWITLKPREVRIHVCIHAQDLRSLIYVMAL